MEKCDKHSSDISKIKEDVIAIRTLLESDKFITTRSMFSEIEKIHNRINRTIIGLSFVAITLGGALAFFVRNGI
jgi:hypothetical protein